MTLDYFKYILAAAAVFSLAANDSSAQNAASSKSTAAAERNSGDLKPDSYQVLTEKELDKSFGEIPMVPPTNTNIFSEKNYTTAVAVLRNRNAKPEHHRSSDRIFLIRKGSAYMRLGGAITDPEEVKPGEIRSRSGTGYADFRIVKLESGMILNVPRDTPYQMIAEKMDVSFIVIRIF